MADDTTTTPSSPTPTAQVLVYTAIRSVLTTLGALGIGVGTQLPDSAWMIVAGCIVTLASVGWSFYQKLQQARLDHAGSVASARGGKAVQVVPTSGVTPS
jgi:hypothetical protein